LLVHDHVEEVGGSDQLLSPDALVELILSHHLSLDLVEDVADQPLDGVENEGEILHVCDVFVEYLFDFGKKVLIFRIVVMTKVRILGGEQLLQDIVTELRLILNVSYFLLILLRREARLPHLLILSINILLVEQIAL